VWYNIDVLASELSYGPDEMTGSCVNRATEPTTVVLKGVRWGRTLFGVFFLWYNGIIN
jgi:hypothetical protein